MAKNQVLKSAEDFCIILSKNSKSVWSLEDSNWMLYKSFSKTWALSADTLTKADYERWPELWDIVSQTDNLKIHFSSRKEAVNFASDFCKQKIALKRITPHLFQVKETPLFINGQMNFWKVSLQSYAQSTNNELDKIVRLQSQFVEPKSLTPYYCKTKKIALQTWLQNTHNRFPDYFADKDWAWKSV